MKDILDKQTVDMFDSNPESVTGNLGRPRVYTNNAEKQKAYRARLAATGVKVISRQVRDASQQKILVSDIIDLSEVRQLL